ncbi:hypothetical protein ACFFHT_00815 [Gallibacterium melopsittaci]|uniref:Uncharacterized protein n=1 Tax=Gallibacterium melopsittaci TaxID=516063 RepID=A0ABV6HTB1_9PAST
MMNRAKSYLLKTRDILFKTKESYKNHLQSILHRAKLNKNGLITSDDDIIDLKDFIQDHCDKSEQLQELFDLDKCYFAVQKSPGYPTECLFIIDNETGDKEQISIHNFGNPPSAIVNFRSFCTYTITTFKLEYRKKLSEKQNVNYTEYDLWHKNPTTKQIVDQFITLKQIGDKLEQVISPNGLGNNVPTLLPEYQYLEQELIEFYQSKLSKINAELTVELKRRP